MPIFNIIDLPYCKVIQIDPWNAPAHRYFIAYRTEGAFRQAIGLSVIDEFATFSSPIFICPHGILGKIYNAGLSLGHMRDPEMGIDLGWPPLCIGTPGSDPVLPEGWERDLLQKSKSGGEEISSKGDEERFVDGFQIQKTQIANVDVYATNAPLLPKQLKRICQLSSNPVSVAFSIGNKLTPQINATPVSVEALSEVVLNKFLGAFQMP